MEIVLVASIIRHLEDISRQKHPWNSILFDVLGNGNCSILILDHKLVINGRQNVACKSGFLLTGSVTYEKDFHDLRYSYNGSDVYEIKI